MLWTCLRQYLLRPFKLIATHFILSLNVDQEGCKGWRLSFEQISVFLASLTGLSERCGCSWASASSNTDLWIRTMVAITTKNVTPKAPSKVRSGATSTGLCVASKTASSWNPLSSTSDQQVKRRGSCHSLQHHAHVFILYSNDLVSSFPVEFICRPFTPAVLWLHYFDYRRCICVGLVYLRAVYEPRPDRRHWLWAHI